ncbi:MAG: hypothetical protein R3320_01890 [Nitriliruptorales bacterium]|nr:hypothetical protein [Nitriliruptorales bacterium]
MDRFQFAFDARFRGFLRLAGIHPNNSEVVVGDGEFRARFGPMSARTPISNITETSITGDYRWWKAIGIRASLKDGGATFGSNTDRGVCVRFDDPVPILFGSLRPHPGLTVTVDDPEGLVAAIESRRTRDATGGGQDDSD